MLHRVLQTRLPRGVSWSPQSYREPSKSVFSSEENHSSASSVYSRRGSEDSIEWKSTSSGKGRKGPFALLRAAFNRSSSKVDFAASVYPDLSKPSSKHSQ